MREWVELFDEPRPHSLFGCLKYHLSVYQVVDFVPAEKILVHRELEVHTVYQRFLTSWQRPTPKEISGYFACLYQVCT